MKKCDKRWECVVINEKVWKKLRKCVKNRESVLKLGKYAKR